MKNRVPTEARMKKKVLPMQHGSAKIDFVNTSRTRTLVLQNVKNEIFCFFVILEG